MESNKSIMKRKGAKGPYLLLAEQSSSESPKMPSIKEQNRPQQHQIFGKVAMSPKEESNSIRLPHIGKCFSEVDPGNDQPHKNSQRKSLLVEGSEKCKSNSSNLNK